MAANIGVLRTLVRGCNTSLNLIALALPEMRVEKGARGMGEDLRQADLSHLALKDMTPEQRAEMRRRLDVFVGAMAKREVLPAAPKRVRKWVPGMKQG